MSKAVDQFLQRVADAEALALRRNGDSGKLLLAVCRAHPKTPDQEKELIKLTNIVIKAIDGFDDYRESFWSLSRFVFSSSRSIRRKVSL